MPRPIDQKQLARVRGVIERAPDGCALADVAAALNPRPPRRNLQRWLAALVRQKRAVRVGHLKSTRYRLTAPGDSAADPEAGMEPLPVRKGSAAHAIQILVARPLAERPAGEYRRAWLDAYEPNKTWYLAEEVRGQLRAAPGVAGGAARLNDPAWRKQFVEDVTYADLPLEGEQVNRLGLKFLLAGARKQDDERRVVKLVWNHRDCVEEWAAELDKVSVTTEAVLGIADWLDSGIIEDENGNVIGETAVRTAPLPPSGTAYDPPGDPATLRAALAQLVATAAAVQDPFEQAFFLFVHLLYLQPFHFNFATACLAANLPLLNAKLLPMAFATVPPRDLRAGALGVCELNRLELLRQVFLQAYFDRLALPAGHPWKR